MGSAEFSLWCAWFAIEEMGPEAEQQRWAQLMAAAYNGPMVKKSKAPFTAAEFLPKIVAPPVKAKPATGASAAQLVKQRREAMAAARARG